MKIQLLALATSLLLCACGPGASTDTTPVTHAMDTATPTTSPAAADPPAPSDDTASPVAPAPPNPASPTTATDGVTAASTGSRAVNDRIDSNLGDHTKYQAVIEELQSAVAAGDPARIASLAHYPIGVDIDGKNVVLKNEKEFVARYKDFMTPDIRKAIVETKYADLFVNYKGVMFGQGEAWINGICKDDKCTDFDARLVALQHAPE